MNEDQDIEYWMARAVEERRIAASLPKGPAALAHLKLAELYEKAGCKRSNGRPTLHISTPPDAS